MYSGRKEDERAVTLESVQKRPVAGRKTWTIRGFTIYNERDNETGFPWTARIDDTNEI
jgi:hypothetical protein